MVATATTTVSTLRPTALSHGSLLHFAIRGFSSRSGNPRKRHHFALAKILSGIFSTSQVKFEIVHGDIMTENRANPRECVRDFVRQSLNRNGYRWKDIIQIIQIGDTDGAFIPDEYVKKSDGDEIRYGEDEICVGDVGRIRKRNARKRQAMKKLASISSITYNRVCIRYISSLATWNMRCIMCLKNFLMLRKYN